MDKNSNGLVAFIESARAKNASDDSIAKVLKEEGWSDKAITQAFGAVYERLTGKKIPNRKGAKGESAKDAFLYLLSFGTLGAWTFALGSMFFTFIDRTFPDPIVNPYYYSDAYSVATQTATIIVTFPIYLLVMWFISKDLATHPEKYESGIRRWLTYLALLIAAAVSIGDLVTFLAYFLRGQLTAPFVLKVVTVLIIAGGVLGYYFTWIKKRSTKNP